MACAGCNRKQANIVAQQRINSQRPQVANLCELDEFERVTYSGKQEYTFMIPSPTAIIRAYNKMNYGLGKRGSVLCVHKDDIAARPDLFEVIVEDKLSIDEVVDKESNVKDTVLLTKESALPLTEFTEQYGYGHHFSVLSAEKKGELKSYKDEEGKTFIYHID